MSSARRTSQFAAAAFAALLIGLLVLRVSDAALSATTTNPGNQFTAASGISLSDSQAGVALFTVSDMAPGQSEQACITVTYEDPSGVDAGVVRVRSDGLLDETDPDDDGDLPTLLTVQVEEVTPGLSCATALAPTTIYTGTLDAFNGITTYAASSAGTWNPAADGETQAYRITVTLDAASDATEVGDSITGLGFVWETQTA